MKTKSLFMAALAAIALTSCQRDDAERVDQPGQETYAGVTISLPKEFVESRAVGDGTAEESKINSVKVGTWSDGSPIIVYTTINASELIPDGNGNYTATKAVKAKTGKTNFFVIANSAEELTVAQINGAALTKTVADIATDNNFVMYSRDVRSLLNVKMATKEQVEAAVVGSDFYASNRTSVTLRRAAAKVMVTSSLTTTDATGILDLLSTGKLYDVKWNIANQNSQMTAIVNRLNSSGPFEVKNVKSPSVLLPNVLPTMAVPKAGDAATFAYCLENSHGVDTYTMANTTAVHVMATFAPGIGKYITGVSSPLGVLTPVLSLVAMVKGTTFYVSKKAYGILGIGLFFTASSANQLRLLFGESDLSGFTEYTNGLCHWSILIHDGAATPNYGVLRNHIYQMNIKSIKAPGFGVLPNLNTPIVVNANIEVDLSVR